MLLPSFEVSALRSEYSSIRMMLQTLHIYVHHMYARHMYPQCPMPQKRTRPLTAALITSQALQKFPYQNKILKLGFFFPRSQAILNLFGTWSCPAIHSHNELQFLQAPSTTRWAEEKDWCQGAASVLATCCISRGIRFQPGKQQGSVSAPWFCLLKWDLPSASLSETQSRRRAEPGQDFPSCRPQFLPPRHQVTRPRRCWQGGQVGGQSLGDAFTPSRRHTTPRSGTCTFKQQQHPSRAARQSPPDPGRAEQTRLH